MTNERKNGIVRTGSLIGVAVAIIVATSSAAYNVAVIGTTQKEHSRRLDLFEKSQYTLIDWMRAVDSSLARVEAKLETIEERLSR